MRKGQVFIRAGKDKEMLISHSGLGDIDYLKAIKKKPDNQVNLRYGYNPYKMFGDTFEEAMDKINADIKADVESGLLSAGQSLKALLLAELAGLPEYAGAETKGVMMPTPEFDAKLYDAVMNLFAFTKNPDLKAYDGLSLTSLAELTGVMEKRYAELPESKSMEFKDSLHGKIFANFLKNIGVDGEKAMGGALPYPYREAPVHPKNVPSAQAVSPGITTSSSIAYYTALYMELQDVVKGKSEIQEQFEHLCQLRTAGIKVVVLGHLGVVGPLIIPFRGLALDKACKAASPGPPISVAFVDIRAKHLVKSGIPPETLIAVDRGQGHQWAYVVAKDDGTYTYVTEKKDGSVTSELEIDLFDASIEGLLEDLQPTQAGWGAVPYLYSFKFKAKVVKVEGTAPTVVSERHFVHRLYGDGMDTTNSYAIEG
jgi:hypothetical protein